MTTKNPVKRYEACLDLNRAISIVTVSPMGRDGEIGIEAGRAPRI